MEAGREGRETQPRGAGGHQKIDGFGPHLCGFERRFRRLLSETHFVLVAARSPHVFDALELFAFVRPGTTQISGERVASSQSANLRQ